MFAFKRFNFFTQSEVQGHGVPDGAVCYATGPSHLYVGDDAGCVTALDQRARGAFAFAAHGHKVIDALYLKVWKGREEKGGGVAEKKGGPPMLATP
eukprot:351151-Chlamydomonas_euryale.AAC.3